MERRCLLTMISLLLTNSALGQPVPPRPLVDERQIALEGKATFVGLSRDGETLVSVINDHRVDVYSTFNGRRIVQFPEQKAPVYAIAISPSGRWVASGGALKAVELDHPGKDHEFQFKARGQQSTLGFGTATRQNAKEFGYQLPLRLPTVNPRVFVSYRGGCVTVWDTKNGESYKEIQDYPDPIVAIGFREDETGLAMLDAKFNYRFLPINSPTQPVIENNNRVPLNRFPSPQTSFSTNAARLASIDEAMNIKLLDSDKRLLRIIPSRDDEILWTVAMAPDGRSFATAGLGGTISIWDFDGDAAVRSFGLPNKRNILFVSFSNDGNQVVSCDQDGRLCLWDAKSGRLLLSSEVSKQDVRAVAFGKKYLTVVSGGFRADPDPNGPTKPLLIQRIDLSDALRDP